MLARITAGLVCLFVMLSASCTSRVQHLPVATPQTRPETATATGTSATATPSATIPPTLIPTDGLQGDNLKQVKLLHQYWLAVATAAGVDPYEMDISAVASTPDGRLIAVGGCSMPLEADLRSGNVYCSNADSKNPGRIPFLLILDANTETVLWTLPENKPGATIGDLAFTPDGRKLIYAVQSGNQPGKFAVWDVIAGRSESTLWEGETSAPRIAISPNGRWIALKTTDKTEIWDTASGKFVTEIPAYFRPQFSADSQRILVYHDRSFVIHETGTWAELLRIGMPCDCVYAASPSLSLLATSEHAPAQGAPIIIWDTSTGVRVKSLQAGKRFTAFLAFSPDGKMLWRAGEHGDLTAWETGEWNFLANNIGGITPVFNLHGFQFTGDGRHYLLFSDLLIALYGLPEN